MVLLTGKVTVSSKDHLIEDAWQILWSKTGLAAGVPKGSTQYQETRRAFYAGVSALLEIQMTGLDAGEEPTEADMAKMDSIHRELTNFVEDLVHGRA